SLQLSSRSRKIRVLSPLKSGNFLSDVAFSIFVSFSSSTTSTRGRRRRSFCQCLSIPIVSRRPRKSSLCDLENHRVHCTDDHDCPVNRLTCGSPGNVASVREIKTNSTHDAKGTAFCRSQIHSSVLRSPGPNSRRGKAKACLNCSQIVGHSKSRLASRTSGQNKKMAASSTAISARCVQVA